MGDSRSETRNTVALFSLALLAFLLSMGLYFFRYLDDDRLTSWEDVFRSVSATNFLLAVSGGIIVAFILSRRPLSWRYPLFSLFVLSCVSTVFFWREPEVIVDVSRYFTEAKYLEIFGIRFFLREWGRQIGAWTDMPLVPLLYGLIFRLFGESRLYIQIFVTLLFSFTALLTYMVGKELWNEETGLYGGVLLLGMPYLMTQVPLMLVDVPTMFFLLCAVFCFVSALRRGGVMIPVAAVALFLSFYSKYSAWLMLSVLAVTFFVLVADENSKGGRNSVCRRGLATALIGGILVGAFFAYKADVFVSQIKFLVAYQKPGLERWGESFLSTFFFQVHPFISLAAIISLVAAFRKKDMKYIIVAWLVILVLVLRIRRIRYLIVVFPMLSLLAAYSIVLIRDRQAKRFIVSCILVLSLGIARFAYLPFLEKISTVNLKEAGQFLDDLPTSHVEVFTVPSEKPVAGLAVAVPILDFFTEKSIIYCPAGGTPLPKDMKTSSLRFTWEFKNPAYYCPPGEKRADAVAIISGGGNMSLPGAIRQRVEGLRLTRTFDTYEGLFSFRTTVRVYEATTGESGDISLSFAGR